jgi:hypothetical protein
VHPDSLTIDELISARTFGEHYHSLAARIVWQFLFGVIEIQ